jgi:hypothetical protein
MELKVKQSLRTNDQGTLFDPENGDSFTLNSSGLLILKQIQAGLHTDEIFAALEPEYDLSLEDFNRLILDFHSLLKSFQLLENE